MINYSISDNEKALIQSDFNKDFRSSLNAYKKHPERYCANDFFSLAGNWIKSANLYAQFQQLNREGIAKIKKEVDEYMSFDDIKGDCYDPDINSGIKKSELQRQERNERARFNRNGVHLMTLKCLGDDIESIGGFIGNDFYGSGYDDDFYSAAMQLVKENHSDYYQQLKAA